MRGRERGTLECRSPQLIRDTLSDLEERSESVSRSPPCTRTLPVHISRNARTDGQSEHAWRARIASESAEKPSCVKSCHGIRAHSGARLRAALLMDTDEGRLKVLRQLHAGKTPGAGEARGLTPRTTGGHVVRTTDPAPMYTAGVRVQGGERGTHSGRSPLLVRDTLSGLEEQPESAPRSLPCTRTLPVYIRRNTHTDDQREYAGRARIA